MTDKLMYLYEYRMSDEEKRECDKLIDIARKYEPQSRISEGNPIYKVGDYEDGSPRYCAGGDCYDSIMAVKKEDGSGFDYYVIGVGDRGYFEFIDFSEFYNNILKTADDKNVKYKRFDAFLYYLLGIRTSIDKKYDYTLKENYVLCVREDDDKRCSLEPIHSYDAEEEKYIRDNLCVSGKAVFKAAMCEKWHRFYYDSSKENADEVKCPICGTAIREK